jgi:NAD(P)-dependent dehydrogenase (short-subunit alcohol dehydrogenase family)
LADRAAIITGGSSGIGLAIARALGEDGYALTVSARRPDKLEQAVAGLAEEGLEVTAAAADVSDEEQVAKLVADHGERYGRLDVLINNAGVGIGGPISEVKTKHLDMQMDVNLRSYVLAMREAHPLLAKAGAEHGKALIVNTASIAGKGGQGWLAVYSATKAGVIGLSQAAQMEMGKEGIQVTALCPGFVDTPMTEWVREQVEPEDMIQPEDLAETVRLLLRTSKNCLIPEIVYTRPGDPSQFAT